MKLSIIATLLSVSSVLAAPAPEPAADSVSMMASSSQWTIKSMKRSCNSANTECTWNFGIYPGSGSTTSCKYVVKGSKASQRNGGPSKCGAYTITSGWSGQFGPGNGFTTLSVVDGKKKQIVWPAYTDKQLAGGKVVKPDQKYSPASLPL